MNWKPITNLPDDWEKLSSPELRSLGTVWEEQADRLKSSGAFEVYMKRLQREIAIETGIIERLYTLDRGITRILIEQGIDEALIPHGATDRPVQQVVALIRDQEAAVEGLFDFVGGKRELSNSYIKQLHQALTQHQETIDALNPATGRVIRVRLVRGDWKKLPNNPMRPDGLVHEYAPPEQVASEMDKLIGWHLEHQEQKVPPEVEAAWLHHRFTQIHPFQDGNGRVARLLASLVFIKARLFPLSITNDNRAEYISALEDADGGDLSQLVELFVKRQVRAFMHSLGQSELILEEERRTGLIISTVVERLKEGRERTQQDNIQVAEKYAALLFNMAVNRLQQIGNEIKFSLENVVDKTRIQVSSAANGEEKSHYYRYQVVETAKQLDYYANYRHYHSWTQLVISIERPTMILISFHGNGIEYHGLLACSVCAYHRDTDEEGDNNINEIQALTDSPFLFSYADEQENLVKRYKKWLEDAIVSGLEYWNKSI